MKNNKEKGSQQDNRQKIAYGAALVARMYPNYALFVEVSSSGNANTFRNILNLVWEYCSGHNQRIDFQKQLDKLEEITPDPEQFDMYGVWPALDATVALASLLSACERWDEDEIDAIVRLSRSTIERYLEAIDEDASDEGHPLLTAEADFNLQCLLLVQQSVGEGPVELITQLKQLVTEFEVSNIGLERG